MKWYYLWSFRKFLLMLSDDADIFISLFENPISKTYTVWPTDMAPVSAYWMYIKTATYRSNSFSCGFIETLPCGVFIAGHFFSHIQCTGAVHGFWSFYYGGKGPYLGVFPILQYKRPQGEEGFFLGISNLGWFDFSEVLCTRGHENWKKLSISFLWSFMYPWSWK